MRTGFYQLPTFRGYTVDMRLREFRRFPLDELPEFIPFDSPEGQRLYQAWRNSKKGKRAIVRRLTIYEKNGWRT